LQPGQNTLGQGAVKKQVRKGPQHRTTKTIRVEGIGKRPRKRGQKTDGRLLEERPQKATKKNQKTKRNDEKTTQRSKEETNVERLKDRLTPGYGRGQA